MAARSSVSNTVSAYQLGHFLYNSTVLCGIILYNIYIINIIQYCVVIPCPGALTSAPEFLLLLHSNLRSGIYKKHTKNAIQNRLICSGGSYAPDNIHSPRSQDPMLSIAYIMHTENESHNYA